MRSIPWALALSAACLLAVVGPSQVSATATAPPPSTAPASETPPAETPTVVVRDTATATALAPAPTPAPSQAVPTGTSTFQVPPARPILVLDDTYVDPSRPAPGADLKVTIEVKNVGVVDAENVQLALSSAVFLALDRGAVLFKEEIDAGETRPFQARLRVDSAAAAGVHPLNIELRWEDASGFTYVDATSIGIQVVGAAATVRPQLVVVASTAPGRVAPGVPFGVSLTVRNGGGTEARNVSATSSGEVLAQQSPGGPVAVPPGGEATLALTLVAAETAANGAVSQPLEIRYFDPDGEEYLLIHPISTVIVGQGAAAAMPIVLQYDAGGDLYPGDRFELVLYVANVGSRPALRTRLVLGGDASAALPDVSGASASTGLLGAFAPLETSNVRFLGDLAAGRTETVVQPMVVDGTAKPGVYSLPVSFEYADAEGTPQISNASVSLVVRRAVRLELLAVDVITSTVVGDREDFSLELVNAGDAEVSVGTATVEGDAGLAVEDGTAFVGPLEAGGYFPIDARLVASSPGTSVVTVRVAYVDDFGREEELVETYEVEIDEVEASPQDTEAPPEAASSGWSLVRRALKGFLGLGASAPLPEAAPDAGPAGGEPEEDEPGGGPSLEITVP